MRTIYQSEALPYQTGYIPRTIVLVDRGTDYDPFVVWFRYEANEAGDGFYHGQGHYCQTITEAEALYLDRCGRYEVDPQIDGQLVIPFPKELSW